MLVAVLGAATMNAQFEKGGKVLSGQLTGFNLSYETESELFNFGIQAAGAYFVADNFAVEAMLGLGIAKMSENDAYTSFGFGVGARYYFYNALFAGVDYQGWTATDEDLASYGTIKVGYTCYIKENVFFEPAVYFQRGLSDNTGKTNEIGLSIGIGVNF